jgi:hypothetical protein
MRISNFRIGFLHFWSQIMGETYLAEAENAVRKANILVNWN